MIAAHDFQLGVNQKIFNQMRKTFPGVMDDLAHLRHVPRRHCRGVVGQDFTVGQYPVERCPQLVWQHHADVVA